MVDPHKAFWDREWNPMDGCSHAGSPGCDSCCAMARARLLRESFEVQLHHDRLYKPLGMGWQAPQRVLTCWRGDLFHEDVPFNFISEVFSVMGVAWQHTFLVLTKRIKRAREWFGRVTYFDPRGPFPNVWVGTTAENQEQFERRVVDLCAIPAQHFVNVEPMLGPIDDMTTWAEDNGEPGVDWVHCAGEYGPGARPLALEWARSLLGQCQAAGVPFYFKGAGEGQATPADLDVREFPEGLG